MALLPLESNPDVMNKFIHLLGVPSNWNLTDVYGLDGEALTWVPKPVVAVILLFPCSEQFYKHAEEEKQTVEKEGQILVSDLYYMKQYVSNACGTVALIHSIANNAEKMGLNDGPFKEILAETKDLTPEERGEILLESKRDKLFNLISTHQELAMEGETEVSPDHEVNHHFVALVEKGGYLYELDGRKAFPINHGPCTTESFLEDAAKICREFIKRDSEDVNFTVMALSGSQ